MRRTRSTETHVDDMSSTFLALASGRYDTTSTIVATVATKDADNKDLGFRCDTHNANVVISRANGAGNVSSVAIFILALQ